MARAWAGAALLLTWLGAAGLVGAQGPPTAAAPGPVPPGYPVPPGFPPGDGAGPGALPPGYPTPPGFPPAPGCPAPPPDCRPDPVGPPAPNAFAEPCEQCKPTRLGLGVEYLHWWLRPGGLPPLLTSGSVTDPVPGALGQPRTQILIGDSLPIEGASGLRLSLDYRLTEDGLLTADVSGFVLENTARHLSATGSGDKGNQVLARPFFNANTGQEDADPVAVPDAEAGTFHADTLTRFLGSETNVRLNQPFAVASGMRCSLLAGARFLYLDDQLNMRDDVADLPRDAATSQTFHFQDTFTTYNRFYGGQVGLEMAFRALQMSLDVQAKLAVGDNVERVGTDARTQIENSGGQVIAAANDRGLLVQPTNFGTVRSNTLSLVPEVTANWAYEFNRNVRFFVGYDFLYWNHVARAGDQIDRVVSVQPVPARGSPSPPQFGADRPVLGAQQGSFWAQGVNVGFEFRY